MALLTAEQAAAKLKRTERTVRRWITEGKLPATHPMHGHTSKFLIEESEVDKLAQELAQFEIPGSSSSEQVQEQDTRDTSSLLERVNLLEQEVQDYRSMVAQLEQRLTHIEAILSERTPAQAATTAATAPTRTSRATAPTETPENVPEGSILYGLFAKNHGVPDGTFRDQIDDGKVQAIVFPKPNRPREKARWLTPEQQMQALAFWTRNGTIWHPCELASCPCHDTSEQDTSAT